MEKDIMKLYEEVDKDVKIDGEICNSRCLYLIDLKKYRGECILFKRGLKGYMDIRGNHVISRCSRCKKEFCGE